jgi:hypothetical protein
LFKTVVLSLLASVCWAADWSSLYDSSKLEAEKPRLQKAVNFLVEKEITPFLSRQAATSFGLADIDLPVSGFRSNPLDFYAQDRRIVLPVRTLLFIEDLSRAYGWLWANRYTTRTVDEYLSMLRYRNASDFAGGRYPPPLEALHVPENALADPRVVEASVRLRRTAYAFILLHQFAHLHLHHEAAGHSGYPEAQRERAVPPNDTRNSSPPAASACPFCASYSEAQEEEADRYALDIMKDNSVTPTGVLLVMQSLLFFETGAAGTLHPVTSHRLAAIAHYMDARVMEFIRGRPDKLTAMDGIHSIASVLADGAQWLGVRSHQEELRQLALKTDLKSLQPRALPQTTK